MPVIAKSSSHEVVCLLIARLSLGVLTAIDCPAVLGHLDISVYRSMSLGCREGGTTPGTFQDKVNHRQPRSPMQWPSLQRTIAVCGSYTFRGRSAYEL